MYPQKINTKMIVDPRPDYERPSKLFFHEIPFVGLGKTNINFGLGLGLEL